MFENTVKLVSNPAGTDVIKTTVVVDQGARKTIRSSADGGFQLSIAHTESNENPGFITQRSNVRTSHTKSAADTTALVTAYGQLTLSFVKSEFTVTEVTELVQRLVNLAVYGDNSAGANIGGQAASAYVGVPRLYAGEP